MIVAMTDKNGLLRSKKVNKIDTSKLRIVKSGNKTYSLLYEDNIIRNNCPFDDILKILDSIQRGGK